MESNRSYTIKDLNPRSEAAKGMEMTVLRALQLIEAFDALEPDQDWTDVPGATYRKIIGDRYEHGRMLEEVYNRWKYGTLYSEVLDLFSNLPPGIWKVRPEHDRARRKELDWRNNAISEIRRRVDRPSKRRSASPPSGGRRRRQPNR